MTTQIALLRAVNVGGRGKVAMADLRDYLVSLGFANVRTVLQSGNVVMGADGLKGVKLEQFLEGEFLKRFGLRTDVVVRSAAEWDDLVATNPFPDEAKRDPSHLLAMMAKRPVTRKAFDTLRSAVSATGGRETVGESGGRVYIYFPDGIGRSRVTTALVERALGGPVTGRNWNTILKLAELA
ncbi:MAG TPA: DUF1697 domain-containing protein [Tepidisphaeraceae bacterium]|jgi:uncharacterized protein (DUF1697 family)